MAHWRPLGPKAGLATPTSDPRMQRISGFTSYNSVACVNSVHNFLL